MTTQTYNSGEKCVALVLGSAGYVGGELLRLLAAHPNIERVIPVSRSAEGQFISQKFGHLVPAYDGQHFVSLQQALKKIGPSETVVVFSALGHGQSAATIQLVLEGLQDRNIAHCAIDLSADFRFSDHKEFESIYGIPHEAPSLADSFYAGLPDLASEPTSSLVAQPGCFTTAVTLAAAPLVKRGLCSGSIVANCVTGSTGSGQTPKPTTHHPERQSNFVGYNPLKHRHSHEIKNLLSRIGEAPSVKFLPHSGPFARGIHATLCAPLAKSVSQDDVHAAYREFYFHSPFVFVVSGMPKLKNVVGSNFCHIGITVEGDDVVVYAVIDNLVKGSAGGAIQWMNRLLGLPQTTGLEQMSIAWN